MGARLAVGLLGIRVLAAQAMDLRALVVGLASRNGVLSGQATLGRPLRLLDRLLPGAVHPHDLGAMDQAATGEGDQIGLALAPLGQGSRPLSGAAKVVRLLAGEDDAAVDDP